MIPKPLAAESAADIRRQNPDLLLLYAEHLRQRPGRRVDHLGCIVDGELVPIPRNRRRVKLEVTPRFYARADEIWGPLAADWASHLLGRLTAEELELAIEFLRITNELSRRHLGRLREMG